MDTEPGRRRRSIRLKDFDYARGAVYFVTICTDQRRCSLGRVKDGETHLFKLGRVVEDEWLISAEMRRHLDLDAYVIMPNHLHGIVAFFEPAGAEPSSGRARAARPYAETLYAKACKPRVLRRSSPVSKPASRAAHA